MPTLKRYAACLAAGLILTATGAYGAAAPGVVLKNEMEKDIKAVYCANEQGNAVQVTGALAEGASVTVTPDKLPEYECARIAVLINDDEGWQFYHEPEPAAAKSIVFAMDPIGPNAAPYPSLLIESGDETYVSAAGVPLFMVTQLMQFGMDKAKWQEISTPNLDPLKTTDFVVAFADQSWNLHGTGVMFAELAGMQLMKEMQLEAPFGNTTVFAVLEGLKNLQAAPVLLSYKGSEQVLDDAVADDARWQAVEELLGKLDDGGQLRMMFGSEDFSFGLSLDLDNAKAVLVIERKEGAAFG